jgi:GMP synthase-like glutamine amidotransferase
MSSLRIHCFQHVDFEDLGCIKSWIEQNSHSLTYTRFYANQPIPESDQYDWLIVMGGPMGVYDDAEYPWLKDEKVAINQAIDASKTVIGICLGSQLIAEALGARVYKNPEKEIGWFDITLTDYALAQCWLGKDSKLAFKVFHWHGDTYHLPPQAIHLAYSQACVNQAFIYNGKVLGLQFHFEVTRQSIREMITNGQSELVIGKTVQTEDEIIENLDYIDSNNQMMFQILNDLAKK